MKYPKCESSTHSKPALSKVPQAMLLVRILTCLVLFASLLFSSLAQAQAPALKLRYNFEDTGPGTTTPSDTSGGGVDVSLQMLNKSGLATNLHGLAKSGVAGLTSGGRALDLSSNLSQGASGNFAATTNANLAFGNVTNFAVTMWMKQSIGLPNTTGGRMFILGSTAATDAGSANSIGMKWQAADQLNFYVNNAQAAANFPSNLPTNSWIFVAMVYDGADVSLYEGTETTAATLVTTFHTVGQIVPMGAATALFLGNRPARDRDFVGWIDDFRFYDGDGDASFVESIRQAAAGPLGLKAAPNDSRVALSWNACVGATSYNVKRGTASGTYTSLGTVTETNFTDLTAINGTTYYYVVSATTANGVTANSAVEVRAIPNLPPSPPTGFAATAGTGSVKLNWWVSTGATSYNIKRSILSGAEITSPM